MINKINFPAFPTVFEENQQLVGYTSECKHCFQSGHLTAYCTNLTPVSHCLWGWYTGGLLPDSLCQWYEPNKSWVNVSTNYYVNRANLIKNLGLNEISEKAKAENQIGEYLYHPFNLFIIGSPKDIGEAELVKKWGWLKIGTTKQIYRISFTEDLVKLKSEILDLLELIPGLGLIPTVILVWDDSVDKSFVEYCGSTIRNRESMQTVNITTRLMHSEMIQQNEILNLANLTKDIWAYDLKDCFKDKPVLCVAGGPSLSKDLGNIKENQDKFIIICVSTVAELLFKNGIIPDIIGTIDMKKDNAVYLKYLTEDQMKQSVLLYEIDANDTVVDSYLGKRIMLCSDLAETPITGALCSYLKRKPNSNIHKSGTVSNMIYQFAKFGNAKEIILAGYDLCYPTNNSHADGSRLSSNIEIMKGDGGDFIRFTNFCDDLKTICESRGMKLVDGGSPQVDQTMMLKSNNDKLTYTTKTFFTYLQELNMRINEEPKINTIDISEVGLAKQNATYASLESIVGNYTKLKKENIFNYSEIISRGNLKRFYDTLLKSNRSTFICDNHKAKLAIMLKQYFMNPELQKDNIIVDLQTIIRKEATEDINRAIVKAKSKLNN